MNKWLDITTISCPKLSQLKPDIRYDTTT